MLYISVIKHWYDSCLGNHDNRYSYAEECIFLKSKLFGEVKTVGISLPVKKGIATESLTVKMQRRLIDITSI